MNHAQILATLYNAAKPLGMGFLQYDPTPMTEEEAQEILEARKLRYFDYFKGRVMKIDISQETLDTHLYNRDNGPNMAEQAIAAFESTGDVNALAEIHKTHTQEAAVDAVAQPEGFSVEGSVLNLGLDSSAKTAALRHLTDKRSSYP